MSVNLFIVIQDTDLLYHSILNQDASESPGAFFGIIAYKGLSSHPVQERKDNDNVTSVSFCACVCLDKEGGPYCPVLELDIFWISKTSSAQFILTDLP